MQAHAQPTVVLVHGAWTDASSWMGVIQVLQAAGHPVLAVQLDLAALAGDVAVTRAVLAAHHTPMVLVGHCYGGAVIGEAAAGMPHVRGVVYVAAFAPDEGESVLTATAGFPHAPGFEYLIPDDRPGYLRIDPIAYPQVVMQDVDPAQARALAVTQRAIADAALSAPAGPPAWRTLPSWYLVAGDDRMINPDAARAMAARMAASTTTLPGAGHAAPVAHPAEVAHVIRVAALGRAHQ